jgi:transposase
MKVIAGQSFSRRETSNTHALTEKAMSLRETSPAASDNIIARTCELDPFCQTVGELRTIPVSDLTAGHVSEIGTDMSRFPTTGHLISWAGLCPRKDQGTGKRRSTRLRKGALAPRLPSCNAPGPPEGQLLAAVAA